MTVASIPVLKTKRASGIEFLRLLSLFGIILCHALSDGKSLTGINKYFCLLANSGIHAGVGVVCFMLITGYFGANFSLRRFNKTYSVIYICSLVCLGCAIIAYGFSPMTALLFLLQAEDGGMLPAISIHFCCPPSLTAWRKKSIKRFFKSF